jgi:hypothetical protein
VEPEGGAAVDRRAGNMMRQPISLERVEWDGAGEVVYQGEKGHDGGPRHTGKVGVGATDVKATHKT